MIDQILQIILEKRLINFRSFLLTFNFVQELSFSTVIRVTLFLILSLMVYPMLFVMTLASNANTSA